MSMLRIVLRGTTSTSSTASFAATAAVTKAHCRAALSTVARGTPRKRRWPRRVARTIGAGAVITTAAAVALPPGVQIPVISSQTLIDSASSSNCKVDNALLTLRLSAILAAALHYSETRDRLIALHDLDSSSVSRDDSSFEVPHVVSNAIAVAKQLLELLRTCINSSSSDHDDSAEQSDASLASTFQRRVVEQLADIVLDASAIHSAVDDDAADALLRTLINFGLVEALLQHLVRANPSNEQLVRKIVLAIESLLTVASVDSSGATAHNVSLATLGAALDRLVATQALRFTDLLRIGELLSRAHVAGEAQQRQHFAAAPASNDADVVAGLRGFVRLLSPEMPSALKLFSLWALTSMLTSVEQLAPARQRDLMSVVLSPAVATLLLALPRSNESLQREAAALVNVLLHLAAQQAPHAPRATYELWLQLIQRWASPTASTALQLESTLCLRTLSSHPRGRQVLSESSATMATLYDLARRLHDAVALHTTAATTRPVKTTMSKWKRARAAAAPSPLHLELHDAIAMQRHVSRAVRNVCTSYKDGQAALTSSETTASAVGLPSPSSLLLLQSRRTLPMSRVFRSTTDLSDLPVVGADEYESSTDLGWIDILTSWTGSAHRDVRRNAIDSLVHLTEPSSASASTTAAGEDALLPPVPTSTTQDLILQAWLTRMLQHVRHVAGGNEILAVTQVEAIAQLTHELTPGNEAVQFRPAVVDAGVAALAVLVQHHFEELMQQGVVPLIALLSQSRLASSSNTVSAMDLKTQCARVLANLVATSCKQLEAVVRDSERHDGGSSSTTTQQATAVVPADVLSTSNDDNDSSIERRRVAWQQFVADTFDVERMLQQTPSGQLLRHELERWHDRCDAMERSSYYRAVANMAAYRAFAATGSLECDVYSEGVHPIVPYGHGDSDDDASVCNSSTDDPTAADTTTTTLAPAIDLVFVHGLRGHPFGTWRTDMSSAVDGHNDIWPDVLLARDLADRGVSARLVTLGYEANVVSWSSPWPSLTLAERARVMLDALYAANIGGRSSSSNEPNERPRRVVFVTHSMGGILVKKMLLLAHEQAMAANASSRDLAARTSGTVFLAVPHFGSDLAKGVRSEAVRSLIKAHPALQDLVADHDGRLEALNDAFRALGIDCLSIGEAKPAPLALGLSAVVVKPESADPGYGAFYVLDGSDHMTICKAKSVDEPHYRAILDFVLACAQDGDAGN